MTTTRAPYPAGGSGDPVRRAVASFDAVGAVLPLRRLRPPGR